jgi:hypothetical protein
MVLCSLGLTKPFNEFGGEPMSTRVSRARPAHQNRQELTIRSQMVFPSRLTRTRRERVLLAIHWPTRCGG